MNVIDFVSHLRRTGHFVEISIPGKITGKSKLDLIESQHGPAEEYFKKLAEVNRLKNLSATTYIKNGNNWKRKDFFLVDTGAIVNETNKINEATNNINNATNEINNSAPIKPTTDSMSDVKTEIENIRLTTELRFTKQRADDLEERVKALSTKYDKLSEENIQLIRDKNKAADEADIRIRQAKLDSQKEKVEGLSGTEQLVSLAKDLPKEFWVLAGSFKKDNPFKNYLTEGNESNAENLAGSLAKHSDPDAQSFIEACYNMLVNQSTENITMITQLIEDFGLKPERLKQIYVQLHPPAKATA